MISSLPILSMSIDHHMMDHVLYSFGPFDFTMKMLVMSVVSFMIVVLMVYVARTAKLVPAGFANVIEPILVFVRDDVVYKVMSPEKGEKLLPFFWTIFFFVLFNNLSGLAPGCSTPTANISTTATLSIIAFTVMLVIGIRKNGLIGFFVHLVPSGIPKAIWPLLFVLELVGVFSKYISLAIRLLANMVACHLVLIAFLSMIFLFKSYVLGGVVTIALVLLNVIDLMIAVLQAYIFTFLAAMFIGDVMQKH